METRLTPRTDKAAFREKVVRGEPVTAQEVFDVAVEGVILQGGPSVSGKSCVYRARNGRECAAGQLIPDEIDYKLMEGNSFGGTRCSLSATLAKHFRLVADLQCTHDEASSHNLKDDRGFLNDFARRVSVLARAHNLTVPPLAQLEEPSSAPG